MVKIRVTIKFHVNIFTKYETLFQNVIKNVLIIFQNKKMPGESRKRLVYFIHKKLHGSYINFIQPV